MLFGESLTSTPQMFINCPHRSCHIEQMGDILTQLLTLRKPYPSDFLMKAGYMARSAFEANRSFLDTKMLMTTRISNILSKTLRAQSMPQLKNTKDEDSEGEGYESTQKTRKPDLEVSALLSDWIPQSDYRC